MAYFLQFRHPLLDNRYARSSEVNFARVLLGARDMTAAKVGRTASFQECTGGAVAMQQHQVPWALERIG